MLAFQIRPKVAGTAERFFVVSNRLPPTFTGTMAAALLAGAPSTQQLQLTRFVILRNGCDECAASTVCGFGGVRLMLDKVGQGT